MNARDSKIIWSWTSWENKYNHEIQIHAYSVRGICACYVKQTTKIRILGQFSNMYGRQGNKFPRGYTAMVLALIIASLAHRSPTQKNNDGTNFEKMTFRVCMRRERERGVCVQAVFEMPDFLVVMDTWVGGRRHSLCSTIRTTGSLHTQVTASKAKYVNPKLATLTNAMMLSAFSSLLEMHPQSTPASRRSKTSSQVLQDTGRQPFFQRRLGSSRKKFEPDPAKNSIRGSAVGVLRSFLEPRKTSASGFFWNSEKFSPG